MLTVRTAQISDAPFIAEIYNEGIRERIATFETQERKTEDIQSWFEAEYPFLVAVRQETVLGFVRASQYRPRHCYAGIAEYSIYVHNDARNQGVGDALMQEFLLALKKAGFWKTLSRIFPENLGSLALCKKHGFRIVGTYEKHAMLDGHWRDVVIVEKILERT